MSYNICTDEHGNETSMPSSEYVLLLAILELTKEIKKLREDLERRG